MLISFSTFFSLYSKKNSNKRKEVLKEKATSAHFADIDDEAGFIPVCGLPVPLFHPGDTSISRQASTR